MKSNKIIAILVIIFGMSGSVYMLYLTFSTVARPNNNPVFQDPVLGGSFVDGGSPTGSILPFGTKMDTEKLREYNPTQRVFPYPTVSPSEIGKPSNFIY